MTGLLLASVALLLLAGAVELWWGSAARQRRREAFAHLQGKLPGGPGLPPALPARSAGTAREARALPWNGWLLRAGLPPGWRLPLLLGVPGLALAALAAWRIGTWWALPVVFALIAALLWLWLRMRIDRRQQQILRQLPDFLDAMVRLAGIGNSLPMAFQTATASVQQPLREILDHALRHVRAGHDLDRALQQAAQPYRLDALELLHVVLGTGMRMGGRADHILQRMADFMRDLSHSRQELKAVTSETRLSAWVLGLLPLVVATFMTLANPAFFRPMFSQPLGHHILLAALALEGVGAVLLYRLAKSL